jgi:hypothetical protein
MLQRLLPIVAELDSSLIQTTRELQSVCEDILASGTVEQVSHLFDPPSLLAELASINLDVLQQMDAALLQSGYLSGPLSTSVSQAGPSSEAVAPEAGPSTSSKGKYSTVATKPVHTDVVVMSQPSIVAISDRRPSPEVPETPGADSAPEEDELAMSGVEDTTGDTVENAGKGAAEDATAI